MQIDTNWDQIAIYAIIGALILLLIQRIPVIGRLVRFAFSFALVAFCLYLLLQQAPYQPMLARITDQLGIDGQKVEGDEVRIRLSPNGHFWANTTINGVERRMMIDSGATVTTISEQTAREASVKADAAGLPLLLRTANGVTQARAGKIDSFRLGAIEANDLKVAISPAIGNLDVLGMNFLGKLASWRVENTVLILVPKKAEAKKGASPD